MSGSDNGFALAGRAVVEYVGEVVAQLLDDLWGWAAGASSPSGRLEVAVLERGQVAVDRGFGLLDVGGDGGQFAGLLECGCGAYASFDLDGGGDQVGAGVEAGEGVGDGRVE